MSSEHNNALYPPSQTHTQTHTRARTHTHTHTHDVVYTPGNMSTLRDMIKALPLWENFLEEVKLELMVQILRKEKKSSK